MLAGSWKNISRTRGRSTRADVLIRVGLRFLFFMFTQQQVLVLWNSRTSAVDRGHWLKARNRGCWDGVGGIYGVICRFLGWVGRRALSPMRSFPLEF